MAKLDFNNLGFDLVECKSYISYEWTEGSGWSAGELINGSEPLAMPVYATALHYGQACFEGLKAFRMKDGKVRIFRPQLNAARLQRSCQVLAMAAPPTELFLDALVRVVQDNIEFVPPYGLNGSLYIRPLVFGSGAQIGLTPAKTIRFVIVVNPVGDYYKGGLASPVNALIQHGFDRAAPNGCGSVKVSGNYGPVFKPTINAKQRGYSVMLFLDSKTDSCIEEFATSNFAALTRADPSTGCRTYVTPKSSSILPSVTNRSLTELAAKHFHWNVERRVIRWSELQNNCFDEVAACGTAVVITPVASIDREVSTATPPIEASTDIDSLWIDDQQNSQVTIERVELRGNGSGFKQLYEAYRQLQSGELHDWQSYHWMYPEEGI